MREALALINTPGSPKSEIAVAKQNILSVVATPDESEKSPAYLLQDLE